MVKKTVDDIIAKYDRDPQNTNQWVGVVYFERPHSHLPGKKDQFILRTGRCRTEGEARAWCRANLNAVTAGEVNALLAQRDSLSVLPTETVKAQPVKPQFKLLTKGA